MSAALPAAAIVTGQYRALTLYEAAPLDCGTVLVPNDAFAPHLTAGEWAVIDPDDNEPVAGELFVIKVASPHDEAGYRLRVVQLRSKGYRFGGQDERGAWRPDPEDSLGWMMHFQLIRPRPTPRFYATEKDALANVSTWTLCDGPLQTDGMRRYIVGRVIGVVLP